MYFRIRIRTPKVKLLPDSFSAEMVKTHCVVANRLVLDRTAAIPILLIIDCLYWIRTSVVEPIHLNRLWVSAAGSGTGKNKISSQLLIKQNK